MPSPSISPSSTRSPSPPTGQIKYFIFTNFNFKISNIQPSCLLSPSKPAFLLFPTLNFLPSLFPSHSQLKIFNLSHFTFRVSLHFKTSTFFTLITPPSPLLSLTLKNLTQRSSLSKTQPTPPSPPLFLIFKIQRHPTFLSPPFSLPTDIYLKLELSTPFYKVAPTKTQSPQNLFGTISDDSRNLSKSAEI